MASVKIEEGAISLEKHTGVGDPIASHVRVKVEEAEIVTETTATQLKVVETAALLKAKRLALPRDAAIGRRRWMYRATFREKYGIDRDSGSLVLYHTRKLRRLLKNFVEEHKWHQACGVLGVLLGAPCNLERKAAVDSRSDYFTAMEVLRRVEDVQSNDITFKRMFRVLNRGMQGARARGKLQMELAFYLMSVGDRDGADTELRPVVDGPIFRDDPVINLCHGLNSYCLWFEKVTEEMSKELGDQIESQKIGTMEEMGENEMAETDYHRLYSDGSSERFSVRRDSHGLRGLAEHHQEDIVGVESGAVQMELDATFFSSQRSIYEETDERGFVKTGEQFWDNAIVPYSEELDERLFPVKVPHGLAKIQYEVPMTDGRTRDLHAAAVKHLKQALANAPDMVPALLPLVQLLLVVHDLKGAVDEIEKCSQALNRHFIPPSIKVLLLESLDQKDPKQLATCHQNVLVRDPLSLSSLKSIVKLHASGNLETELLLECLCLHLDVHPGEITTWKKLASCFLELDRKLSQWPDGASIADLDDGSWQDHIEAGFRQQTNKLSRDYLHFLWSGRQKWWLTRHFSAIVGGRGIVRQTRVNQWLVAYKAACAAHIYGPTTLFVEEASELLSRQEDDEVLKFVRHHCKRSLKLFVD